jgi:hypothetical protein
MTAVVGVDVWILAFAVDRRRVWEKGALAFGGDVLETQGRWATVWCISRPVEIMNKPSPSTSDSLQCDLRVPAGKSVGITGYRGRRFAPPVRISRC